MDKTRVVASLEDQVRKQANLLNQVCSHNFQFLRQKTQEFYKITEQVKKNYENRLMEVEEQLGLEQKRCQALIKTRVAVLEEKYLKGQTKEQELNKKIKEQQLQKDNYEKEMKILNNKIKDQQQQVS